MVLWPLLFAITIGSYARVSEIEGDVVVEREGEYQPLTVNFLVEPGDRILAVDGRAELEFRYRTVVWIDKGADLLVHRIERDIREFELREGKATVLNRDQGRVRVVIPQGEIDLTPDTRIRVHVEEDGNVWVSVLDGKIYVDTDEMRLVAREGEELEIDEFGELTYRSHSWDEDFYRWCDHRYPRFTVHISVNYWEPVTWVGFWDLVPYGEWVWIPPYGWVWVPRVTIGWQPYLYGYWTFRPGIGWVWVSYEPWGWIPYHYGRWAYVPGYGWVWVPGRTFAGAWVAWHVSSNTVAWAPLGPHDRVPTGPNRRSPWIAVTRESFEHPSPRLLVEKPQGKIPYERVTMKKPVRKWTETPSLRAPKIKLPALIREDIRKVALEKMEFSRKTLKSHRTVKSTSSTRAKGSLRIPRVQWKTAPEKHRNPEVHTPKTPSMGIERGRDTKQWSPEVEERRQRFAKIPKTTKKRPAHLREHSRSRRSPTRKSESSFWLRSVESLGRRISRFFRPEPKPQKILSRSKGRKSHHSIDIRNVLKDNQ